MPCSSSALLREVPLDDGVRDLARAVDEDIAAGKTVLLLVLRDLLLDLLPGHVLVVQRDADDVALRVALDELHLAVYGAVREGEFVRVVAPVLPAGRGLA